MEDVGIVGLGEVYKFMGMGQDHVLDPVLSDWNRDTKSLLCSVLSVDGSTDVEKEPLEMVGQLFVLPVQLREEGRCGKLMVFKKEGR